MWRLMQTNPDIGKIKKPVPELVDRAVRRFVKELTNTAALYAMQQGKSGNLHFKLQREHVRAAIDNTTKFGFLKKAVEDVPELGVSELD